MATKLEQRMAAERMAEDERGSKGKATAQIPASSEQKRKLKELGLTGVLTVVPGGFILKGVKGASKVYKTIAAARKAAEAAGKKVSEVSKPNPASAARGAGNTAARAKKDKENQNVTKTGGRNVTKTGKRKVVGSAQTPAKGYVKSKKPKRNQKVVGISKEGAKASSRASQIGPTGLASLDKKDKKKRKVVGSGQTPAKGYVKSKKPKRKSKDSGRDSDLFDTPAGVTSGKKPDDGYRYYGKKGTGLGDFSRKYGMKYATQEQFEKDFDMSGGAKKGGQIKKLAKKKRKGFSGRGAGKALRGF